MAFAGLCILAFGGWNLGLSISMSEKLFLLVAADWNWFSLGQIAGCATALLCGVAWTELTRVDFATRLIVFAGQFMPIVVVGVFWGVARTRGVGYPSLVYPVGLVAPSVTGCLLMERRQPWGRDVLSTSVRLSVGVVRPVSSVIVDCDVIDVNSSTGGSDSVLLLLVIVKSLPADSTGAWVSCNGFDGWVHLTLVASGRMDRVGCIDQLGFLWGVFMLFELGRAMPGSLKDHSIFINLFDNDTAALARSCQGRLTHMNYMRLGSVRVGMAWVCGQWPIGRSYVGFCWGLRASQAYSV